MCDEIDELSMENLRKSWNSPPLPTIITMQTCSHSASSKSNPSSEEDVNLNPNPITTLIPFGSKAYWSHQDEATLIAFFLAKKVGNTASNNMFKGAIFGEAANEINCLCQKGGGKNTGSCKVKWTKVCIFLYLFYLYPSPNLYD